MKIIQISVSNNRVIALCDDNTIWSTELYNLTEWVAWKQLPAIPQPEKKKHICVKVGCDSYAASDVSHYCNQHDPINRSSLADGAF